MRATFVLPDEMADRSIAGLQWFILIPRLNYTLSHKPSDSNSILNPIYIEGKKNKIWNKNHEPAIKKGRGPILYTKNPQAADQFESTHIRQCECF